MLIQRFAAIIPICILTACGYHLRGGGVLPKELNTVYLEGASAQLRGQFQDVLDASSGKLALSPEKAGIGVRIRNEELKRRILSLSSRGRSNEVELDYRLEYELMKSGKPLLSAQPLRIRREYYNDQEDIIAKDNEEKVIRDEIYQQAIQAILNRANAELKGGTH
ncbi:MAG: LPS-assembly lipoprotein LptE [Gammaproteobacteria bacterium]